MISEGYQNDGSGTQTFLTHRRGVWVSVLNGIVYRLNGPVWVSGEMHSTGYQPAELHQVARPNQQRWVGGKESDAPLPKNNRQHDTHDVESIHATKAAMSIKSKCSMYAQP